MEFHNQVVMITGAAGNLGRAVTTAFAAAGATLVLVDINQQVLHATHDKEREDRMLLAADLLALPTFWIRHRSVPPLRQLPLGWGRSMFCATLPAGFEWDRPSTKRPTSFGN